MIHEFRNLDLKGASPEAARETVRFIFSFPQMLEAFEGFDRKALFLRNLSLVCGFFAVFLVFIALGAAATSPIYEKYTHAKTVAHLSAASGIAGTVLGLFSMAPFGVRRWWLRRRLQAEMVRNFHFTYMAAKAPDSLTASGDPEKEAAYVAARDAAFATLMVRLRASGKLFDRVTGHGDANVFHDLAASPAAVHAQGPVVFDFFSAYRKMRLDWQWSYCDAKLQKSPPPGHTSARQSEVFFTWLALGTVLTILTLHCVHAFVHLAPQTVKVIDAAVVVIAVLGLAMRAVENGLGTSREVERYEQYRIAIKVAVFRLDALQDVPAKIETLRAFEHTAVEEMISFVKGQGRGDFLL